MAVRIPELKEAVPFYGAQPTAEQTAQIKASLLLQYAGLDTRVMLVHQLMKPHLKKTT